LGYRGNPAWRDMSEYVVHFCGTRQALVAILTSGAIEGRTPFGWAREFEQERDAAQRRGERLVDYPTQKSVCLSEVPLDLLDRLIGRRGRGASASRSSPSSTTAELRSGTSRRTRLSHRPSRDCSSH